MSETVVERIVADIVEQTPFHTVRPDREWVAKLMTEHVLAALKPGDDLGNGLVAAPREPSPWMLEASWQLTKNATDEQRMATNLASAVDAHKTKTAERYRAMIAAAGQ